jgi:hypothetical protein
LAIRVPNSSWIPLAIYVAISALFFSIHILFQDLSPELLIIHPFLLAACSSSFSFYLPFQVVFQKLLLPFIVAEINSGFFLSSSSLLTIFSLALPQLSEKAPLHIQRFWDSWIQPS